MPNYRGKRPGTRRIVLWAKLAGETKSRPHEWVIEGRKRDGDAFEARKRIELGEKQRIELRTAPTFSAFLADHYGPHAKRHLKASTWRVRKFQLASLEEHLGTIKLSELALSDIERLKSARAAKVEASTVNNELRVLRTVLNYAKALGVAVPEIRWKRLPVRGKGRVRVWTAEQVQALFASARATAPEMVPLLVFLLNTGCRKGEAIACEWSWIDFEADLIRIPSNAYWQPKSNRPREVPLGDAVRAALAGPRKHERWVFPSILGGRYSEFPKDVFGRVRRAAGLDGGPHTTRHTFASHFLAETKDLKLLAEVLGHSHTKVTEIYAHLLPGKLDLARNAVNLSPAISNAPYRARYRD